MIYLNWVSSFSVNLGSWWITAEMFCWANKGYKEGKTNVSYFSAYKHRTYERVDSNFWAREVRFQVQVFFI